MYVEDILRQNENLKYLTKISETLGKKTPTLELDTEMP